MISVTIKLSKKDVKNVAQETTDAVKYGITNNLTITENRRITPISI